MLKLSKISLICIVITVYLRIAVVTQNVPAVNGMGVGNANDETKKQSKVLKDVNPVLYYVGCGVRDLLAYTGP
jgi:hypothetical protein